MWMCDCVAGWAIFRVSRAGFATGGDRRVGPAGRQCLGQALGDGLGLGARDVADDGHDGALRRIVVAMEGDEVVARDALDALHRRAQSVGMAGIDRGGEALGGDAVGTRVGLADAGDGARLFAQPARFREKSAPTARRATGPAPPRARASRTACARTCRRGRHRPSRSCARRCRPAWPRSAPRRDCRRRHRAVRG